MFHTRWLNLSVKNLVYYTNNTYWDQSCGLRRGLGERELINQYKHPEYAQSQLRGGGSQEARTNQGMKREDVVSVATPICPCHLGITWKEEFPSFFLLREEKMKTGVN